MDNELNYEFYDIISNKRDKYLVDLRRVIIAYYTRQGLTSVFIGKLLNRDHSTILYHYKKHEEMYEWYKPYRELSDRLFRELSFDKNYLKRLVTYYNNNKEN